MQLQGLLLPPAHCCLSRAPCGCLVRSVPTLDGPEAPGAVRQSSSGCGCEMEQKKEFAIVSMASVSRTSAVNDKAVIVSIKGIPD
eukprot:951348-Pelagomonas_calceolata.AAC.1